MAPNRKNVSTLLQSLSSSDLESLQASVVQPKYLPLTHPSEQQEQQQQTTVPVVKAAPQQHASASYWDWPADDVVEEEKVADDLFSASHIESNLIQAAAEASSEDEEATKNIVAENDDYWAEASEQDDEQEVVHAPQHVLNASYWEWPTADEDKKQTMIDRIVQDERARTLVSSSLATMATTSPKPTVQVGPQKESNDQYWQWDSTKVAPHVDDASHPNANYWDWESEQPKKNGSSIQAILDYETARQLLTASSIVKQLQQQPSSVTSAATFTTNPSSDGYWNFAERYGDEYWQEQTPAMISATGNSHAGYWDW